MTSLTSTPDDPVEPHKPRWSRVAVSLVVLLALVAVGTVVAVATGSSGRPIAEVLASLTRFDALHSLDASPTDRIVWNVRLPRVALGLLVGCNLAVAGVLLQGIMRNPLASPGIIGVTVGAALFASLAILGVTDLIGIPWLATLSLPMMAFIGALLATMLVYVMSWQPGVGTSPTRMILAGVAVTAMLGAFQSFLSVYFADRIQGVVLWLSGSLNARSWNHLPMIWPFTILGLVIAALLVRPLNLLQLGDDSAAALGVPVQTVRIGAIVAAALLTASAVCVAGVVGFVGLVVPHIVRTAVARDHAGLIPAAALGGAALVVWSDAAARQLDEMPVGILTALIGGPYFVFLLYRKKLI
ncbi:MAG: iron ABC transporter permease [Planctomycetota bacterium]